MQRLLLAGCLLLIAGNASAQASLVVEACKRAAAHIYTTDDIPIATVQDFSALTPPRARLKIGTSMGSALSCTFESRDRPLGLIEYCDFITCYKAGHQRFDEIRYLLEQDGY